MSSTTTAASNACNASTATSTAEGEENLCIICCNDASDKIIRDDNFYGVLDLYWTGIGIDVKPEMNKGFFLCIKCYDNLIQFYEVNDVLVYFEAKLNELRKEILHKNMNGILARQGKGLKALLFQEDIMKEWSTKLDKLNEDAKNNSDLLKTFEVILNTVPTEEENDKPDGDQPQEPKISLSSKRPKRSITNTNSKVGYIKDDSEGETSDDDDGSKEGKNRIKVKNEQATRTRFAAKFKRMACDGGSDEKSDISSKTIPTENKCRFCLDSFTASSQLLKHIRQHKVSDDDDKYECRHCEEQFPRRKLTKFKEHKENCPEIVQLDD